MLAVASAGGHWTQLARLRPALAGCDVAYVSTRDPGPVEGRLHRVPEASQWSPFAVLRLGLAMLRVLLRERPDVVISTGAAPGYVALRLGRLLGARTIWLDSVANAEALSLSGRLAGRHADLWLTQWPHLARAEGPSFAGAVA